MAEEDYWAGLFIGLLIGFFIFGMGIYIFDDNLHITQETANDICKNLANSTESTTFQARTEMGKLICESPSFDHTTNIVFKKTGE